MTSQKKNYKEWFRRPHKNPDQKQISTYDNTNTLKVLRTEIKNTHLYQAVGLLMIETSQWQGIYDNM